MLKRIVKRTVCVISLVSMLAPSFGVEVNAEVLQTSDEEILVEEECLDAEVGLMGNDDSIPHTVSFDANGGECQIESKIVNEGETYGDLPVATRIRCDFSGWYDNSDYNGDEITSDTIFDKSEDIKLYAKWAPKEIQIHLLLNDGSEDELFVDIKCKDIIKTIPGQEPERIGYKFAGWFTKREGGDLVVDGWVVNDDLFENPSMDEANLYAHWTPNKYKITFDYNGADSGASETDREVEFNSKITELPTPGKRNYEFAGWHLENVDGDIVSNGDIYNFNKEITLVAEWNDEEEYETFDAEWNDEEEYVTFDANGGVMPVDPKSISSDCSGCEEGYCKSQAFDYIEDSSGWCVPNYTSADGMIAEREGYVFCGWYDKNGIRFNEFADFTYGQTRRFTARWEEAARTIKAPTLLQESKLLPGMTENAPPYFPMCVNNGIVCRDVFDTDGFTTFIGDFGCLLPESDYKDIELKDDETLVVLARLGRTALTSFEEGWFEQEPDENGVYWSQKFGACWGLDGSSLLEDGNLRMWLEAFHSPSFHDDMVVQLMYLVSPNYEVEENSIYIDSVWTEEADGAYLKSDVTEYKIRVDYEYPCVIFDANGGLMKHDSKVMFGDSQYNEDGDLTGYNFYQAYKYYKPDGSGKYVIDMPPIDEIDPTKEGCCFKGWYDESGNRFTGDSYNVPAKKYIAKWGPNIPAWTKKAPGVSLATASDISFNLKITTPAGFDNNNEVFDYYAAVKLSENKNTSLENGVFIAPKTKYIKLNENGTIPDENIYAFEGSEGVLTKVGEGFSVSLDAEICIVLTKKGIEPEEEIIAVSASKKLTVATKKEYFADKITLKKTKDATKLYADSIEHIVATVDFGKNASYTTKDCWKIVNENELSEEGVYVSKGEYNSIVVRCGDGKGTTVYAGKNQFAPAGTYRINVETVVEDGCLPARASIDVKVLPTVCTVKTNPTKIKIYRPANKSASFTLKPILLDYFGQEIKVKDAKLEYKIGKKIITGEVEPVKGLTINSNGKITVAKTFVNESENSDFQGYGVKVVCRQGDKEVIPTLRNLSIVTDSVDLGSFAFVDGNDVGDYSSRIPSSTDPMNFDSRVYKEKNIGEIPATMTLTAYRELFSCATDGYLESAPATLTLSEMTQVSESVNETQEKQLIITSFYDKNAEEMKYNKAGFVVKSSSEKPIIYEDNLLKDVKVPNPLFIKKTGSITLSATGIDGTCLKKKINIIADSSNEYNCLCVNNGRKDASTGTLLPYRVTSDEILPIDGSSISEPIEIWLETDDGNENTLNNISGDKLNVKGAKIVENMHNDHLKIVMTSNTAVITRTHGKTTSKYTITNDLYNKKMTPKIKVTDTNSKANSSIFLNAKQGNIQYKKLIFDKNSYFVYSDDISVKVNSDNSEFMALVADGTIEFECKNESIVEFKVNPIAPANSKLKAGKVKFTIELQKGDVTLTMPATVTVNFENLKKKFKLTNQYTFSTQEKTALALSYTGTNTAIYFGKDDEGHYNANNPKNMKLLNDNVKGKYNNITDYYEIEAIQNGSGYLLKAKRTDLPKSITGYLRYTVEGVYDNYSQDHVDKITVKSVNKKFTYKVDTPKVSLKNAVSVSLDGNAVYGNKQKMYVAKAAILDTEYALYTVEPNAEGELCLRPISEKISKVVRPCKVIFTVNVIPKGSDHEGEEVNADNSLPVKMTVNFTK